jgi:hypothetical protein
VKRQLFNKLWKYGKKKESLNKPRAHPSFSWQTPLAQNKGLPKRKWGMNFPSCSSYLLLRLGPGWIWLRGKRTLSPSPADEADWTWVWHIGNAGIPVAIALTQEEWFHSEWVEHRLHKDLSCFRELSHRVKLCIVLTLSSTALPWENLPGRISS